MPIISGSSDHALRGLYAHAGNRKDDRSKFAEFHRTPAKVRRTFVDVPRHSVATVRQSCTRQRDKVRLVEPKDAYSVSHFDQKRTLSYGSEKVGCFPVKIKFYVGLGFQFVLWFFCSYTLLILVQISVHVLLRINIPNFNY